MLRRSLSIFFWFLFFFFLTMFVGGVGAFENWRQGRVTATLETSGLTGPRDALVVDFSKSIREASLAGKIALSPSIPFRTEWHDFGKRLVITPEENWALDATYQLAIGQGSTSWFVRTPVFSLPVASPRLPRIVSVTPADQAKDVLLGVEDPIRIEFDRSVKDFYIDFQFDPVTPAVYQHNPEKTIFEILPSAPLTAGKQYVLSIQARWRNEEQSDYRPMSKTMFTVLAPKSLAANKNFSRRLEDALRMTPARRIDQKYIDVNLASQVMTLFENGRAIDAYMISSGKRGMETPIGEFSIQNKAARPWSKAYSLYMPYWQAITPDGKYGIHELPEWPGGYKEGANHLGTPVSHGCMRLGIGPAKRVFEWAEIGTPVIIY